MVARSRGPCSGQSPPSARSSKGPIDSPTRPPTLDSLWSTPAPTTRRPALRLCDHRSLAAPRCVGVTRVEPSCATMAIGSLPEAPARPVPLSAPPPPQLGQPPAPPVVGYNRQATPGPSHFASHARSSGSDGGRSISVPPSEGGEPGTKRKRISRPTLSCEGCVGGPFCGKLTGAAASTARRAATGRSHAQPVASATSSASGSLASLSACHLSQARLTTQDRAGPALPTRRGRAPSSRAAPPRATTPPRSL